MSDQALEQSPQERMIALLGQEETQEAQQEPEQQEQQESASEGESETEAEAQPEPRKLKLKWNGEEVEKDESEVVELAQKGFDYTQKTQSLADERKAIEAQAQAVKAQEQAFKQQSDMQKALITDIAKVQSIDEQIAQFNSIDWNQLTDTDPVQAQKLFFQYTQLTNKRNGLIQEVQVKHQNLTRQEQLKQQEILAKGQEELLRDIPGWNQEKVSEIREAAKKYGASEDQLSRVAEPWIIKALHDAAQFKKLQSSKSQMENKVAGKPPVVKPGSKDTKATANSRYATDRQALKKSGDSNLAVKLIEQML